MSSAASFSLNTNLRWFKINWLKRNWNRQIYLKFVTLLNLEMKFWHFTTLNWLAYSPIACLTSSILWQNILKCIFSCLPKLFLLLFTELPFNQQPYWASLGRHENIHFKKFCHSIEEIRQAFGEYASQLQ